MLLPGTAAEQAIAVAQRLRQRLDSARITHGAEAVPIRTSLGVAALGNDHVASAEELFKVALGRLERAAAKDEAQRTAPREKLGAMPPPAGAPGDIAAALQILEQGARVGIDLQEHLFLLQIEITPLRDLSSIGDEWKLVGSFWHSSRPILRKYRPGQATLAYRCTRKNLHNP